MKVKEYIFVLPGKIVHSKQEYEIYSQTYMWLGLFCFKYLKCGRFASMHAVLVGPYSDRVVCKSVYSEVSLNLVTMRKSRQFNAKE